jgi:hypothetical protein
VIALDERIVLLAAALSPRSAASALEGLREKPKALALERLQQTRGMNRLQWRQRLAQALAPAKSQRDAVLSAAGPRLALKVRQRLASPGANAVEPGTSPLDERLLKRLVRECGG